MPVKYKIHPAIGIARLGDSPDEFYIAPEMEGGLPIACDQNGNTQPDGKGGEKTTNQFKDSQGRVKRQAARFQIWVYDDKNPAGRELKLGDFIQGVGSQGKLTNIYWFVYLANKKASWYEFEELDGEHGYSKKHPRRNASVTGSTRQSLNIDPGPQWVDCKNQKTAEFAKGKNPGQSQSFPPPLVPYSIDTLGSILTDGSCRLLVLGGHGNSGSWVTEFGNPQIEDFANNDGWFDDTSDGPVTAILEYWDEQDLEHRYIQATDPSWVLVGYPRYAPQIVDMVTAYDVLHDMAVRQFASNTYLYGTGDFSRKNQIDPSDPKQLEIWRNTPKWYNPDYYPLFWKEIWPILARPFQMQWVTDFLQISNDAHDPNPRGDFDLAMISVPPTKTGGDPYFAVRQFIWLALRKEGQENAFVNTTAPPWTKNYLKELMPLLCGDNPINNKLPSKFLRLTDTMLFLLQQWAAGKFVNEKDQNLTPDQIDQILEEGVKIDRGVLANVLGGAFCPGGEVSWILRNPEIYTSPFRIRQDPAYVPTSGSTRGFSPSSFMPANELSMNNNFAVGLGPGDMTKYSGIPWQADFNECSIQDIDVAYELFNVTHGAKKEINITLWWPSHRPMQVYQLNGPEAENPLNQGGSFSQVDWAQGIPQTNAGDLKMVTAWKELGFLIENPAYVPNKGMPQFYEPADE